MAGAVSTSEQMLCRYPTTGSSLRCLEKRGSDSKASLGSLVSAGTPLTPHDPNNGGPISLNAAAAGENVSFAVEDLVKIFQEWVPSWMVKQKVEFQTSSTDAVENARLYQEMGDRFKKLTTAGTFGSYQEVKATTSMSPTSSLGNPPDG